MNTTLPTLPIVRFAKPVSRPINKFDALERFCAAIQNIVTYRQEIADGEDWVRRYPEDADVTSDDRFWEARLESAIGSATIALNQLPEEWKALMAPELDRAVRP